MKKKLYTLIPLILLSTLLFSGCEKKFAHAFKEDNFTPSDKKEKALSRRHLEYWEGFLAKDFNSSYPYEMPYQQYQHSLSWYNRFNNNNVKDANITQLSITYEDEFKANVRTRFQYRSTDYSYDDPWYYVNGTWFHVMKTSLLPKI